MPPSCPNPSQRSISQLNKQPRFIRFSIAAIVFLIVGFTVPSEGLVQSSNPSNSMFQVGSIVVRVNLASARVGVPYRAQASAAGGKTPYQFVSLALPAGLEINKSTGKIFGTPVKSGTFEFFIFVTDSRAFGLRQFELTVSDIPGSPRVTIYPDTVFLSQNRTQQFTAVVTGTKDEEVTWSTSAGQISSSGLFTAPAGRGARTIVVTALSRADRQTKAQAVLTLSPPPASAVPIVISPSTAPVLRAGDTQTFTATQSGSPATVTWSCPGCAGSVNPSTGVYTAPSSITAKTSIGGCQVTPNDSVWNTRVDSLPRDRNSARLMATAGSSAHIYLGVSNGYGAPYGNYDDGTFPGRTMTFAYTPESSGSYKIPPLPDVEAQGGWYATTRDRHILTTILSTCDFQELYGLHDPAANPNAQSGMKYNGDAYTMLGSTSAAATPLAPLDTHFEELENAAATGGTINHAGRLVLGPGNLKHTFIWPAQAFARNGSGAFPYGTRLRLKSSFRLGTITSTPACTVSPGCLAMVNVLITQWKQYGMVVTDGGAANQWTVTAGMAPWSSTAQNALRAVFTKLINSKTQLEVVDETSLMVSPTSSETTTGERVVATETAVPSNSSSAPVVLRGVTINTSKDIVNIQAGMTAYQLPAPYIGGTANLERLTP